MKAKTEAELAATVKKWLVYQGWDVYQEVPCRTGRCDLVAVRGSVVWIVETKLSASMSLVEQCLARLSEPCNGVLAAIPFRRRSAMMVRIAEAFGFGLMEADVNYVSIDLFPPLRRIDTSKFREKLRDEYKTFVDAGTNGTYWTLFKNLVVELQKHLKEGQLKRIMDEPICYALNQYKRRSPAAQRRALIDYLDRGLIPGWKLERRGRELWIVKAALDLAEEAGP